MPSLKKTLSSFRLSELRTNGQIKALTLSEHRILVIGPPGSGKSSHSFNYRNLSNVILDQQDSNGNNISYQNYFRTVREYDGKKIAIEFWETDDSLPAEDKNLVWRNCHGYVIMFDVTQDPTSQFEWIAAAWSCIVQLKQTRDVPCVIVGNKIDSPNRMITTDVARLNVLELSSHIKYCEASKYNSAHSKEIFEDVIDMMLRKKDRDFAEERAKEGIPQQIPPIAPIPTLPSSMKDNMKTVINDPNYSDIEFIIEDKSLYIHRLVILTRLSSVMEGIPAAQKVVQVENIPYDIFYKIMEWLYSGNFSVEPEEANVMRTALFKWRCFPLLPFCDVYLTPDIPIDRRLSPDRIKNAITEIHVKEHHLSYESNDNSSTTSSRRSSWSEDSESSKQVLRSESANHTVFGYTPPSSPSSLSMRVPNFAMIFNEMPFSDVVIHVEDKKIIAHSVFLAARSPQLKTLIANTPKTEPQDAKPNQPPKHELTITDWSYQAMRTLVYYLYADRLPSDIIRSEGNHLPTFLELLGASKAFGVATLARQCEIALTELLDVNNACLIYNQSVKHYTYHLKRYCSEWISYRLQQVKKSEAWQKLPASIQTDLETLKIPGLWVEPEKKKEPRFSRKLRRLFRT